MLRKLGYASAVWTSLARVRLHLYLTLHYLRFPTLLPIPKLTNIPDVPFLVKYDGIHILSKHTSRGEALGRGREYLLYTIQAFGIDSTSKKDNIMLFGGHQTYPTRVPYSTSTKLFVSERFSIELHKTKLRLVLVLHLIG